MTKQKNWTDKERKAFVAFATTSNKENPHHPLDCRKWNEFVIATLDKKSCVTANDIRTAMIDAGWSENAATHYYDKFMEDQELLNQFKVAKGL